jgi:serine/threonine-protein kinase
MSAVCLSCGSPLPPGSSVCPKCKLEPTRVQTELPALPGYRLLRLLGEGGMGAVYLAQDETLGRRVAIKLLSGRLERDLEARVRFLREARAMATVDHPHIVRVYSFGEAYPHAHIFAILVALAALLSVGMHAAQVRRILQC